MGLHIRLYLGFGGSGAKTLSALARKIAMNAQWAAASEVQYAFVLADTDQGDLAKYTDEIRSSFAAVGSGPIVRPIALSEGVPSFQKLVAERLHAARHHRSLQQVWWYRTVGGQPRPFTAERLTDTPEKGASQCPPISAFLAWEGLDTIGKEIDEILAQLKLRATLDQKEKNWTLHASLVTGLAGGTGRGCWPILAYKVREALAAQGRAVTCAGYFFDASVTVGVAEGDDERMRQCINSLTGFSELTAWMRNNEEDPKLGNFRFVLPHLQRPAGEPAIDVRRLIQTTDGTEAQGVRCLSPVDQAYVVFGGGRGGRPHKSEYYYEIVANALYGRLVTAIASKDNNKRGFGGVGSASIEVPIDRLRQYVRDYTAKWLPEQLLGYSMKRASDALERGGVDKQKVQSKMHQTRSSYDQWTGYLTDFLVVSGAMQALAKKDGNLLEQALHGCLAARQGELKRISDTLTLQRGKWKESAIAACKGIDEWADQEAGKSVIKASARSAILSSVWGPALNEGEPLQGGLVAAMGSFKLGKSALDRIEAPNSSPLGLAYVDLIMRDELEITIEREKKKLDLQGFAQKREFALALLDRLRKLAASMGTSVTRAAGSTQEALAKATAGLFSSGVDPAERSEILATAEQCIQAKAVPLILDEVKAQLNAAASVLDSLINGLGHVREELQELEAAAEGRLQKTRGDLFWDDHDFIQREEGASRNADVVFDAQRLAVHFLQPVQDDDGLTQALNTVSEAGANEKFEKMRRDLKRSLAQWATEFGQSTAGGDRGAELAGLRKTLRVGIKDCASAMRLPGEWYADTWGFTATVANLLKAWHDRFAKTADGAANAKLLSSFRVEFGTDYPLGEDGLPQRDMTEHEIKSWLPTVLQSMAASVGARCPVLWETRGSNLAGVQTDPVTVVLPAEDNFDKEFKKALEGGKLAGTKISGVVGTDADKARGNPFMMLAYTQQSWPRGGDGEDAGIDSVSSLDYYRDADVYPWLRAVERPDGLTYWPNSPEASALAFASDCKGLGFLFPFFVRDEVMKARRWRPWARDAEAEASAELVFGHDCLLYALLDEPSTDMGDKFRQSNDAAGWVMPLITLKGQTGPDSQSQAFQFERAPMRTYLGALSPDHPACRAGTGYTSIKKVLDDLNVVNSHKSDAIADEAVLWIRQRLLANPDQLWSAEGLLSAMWRDLERRLRALRDAQTGHVQDEYQALIDQAINRIPVLAKMSLEELSEHFSRRGRK